MTKKNEEIDSEEEEELKDQTESKFTLNFEIEDANIPSGIKFVVISNPGCPQALFKIVLDKDLKEIGKVTATQQEKTKDCLTLFTAGNLLILQVDPSIQGAYCSQIVDTLWTKLEAK